MWNSDTPAYTVDTDPLYQSIPFYVGLQAGVAYGVFLDNAWRTTFDVAASEAEVLAVSADGGAHDHYVFAGPDVPAVVERYTALTGRASMPPRWALGYHQCRWSYYPASEVLAIAQELRDRKIPADGMWLDIDYMDGFRSFTWDPVGFADPAALVGDLQALGFEATAIIDPGLKEDPAWSVYQDGLAGGHFLQDPAGGGPFVGEVWPGASVFPGLHAAADAGLVGWAVRAGDGRGRVGDLAGHERAGELRGGGRQDGAERGAGGGGRGGEHDGGGAQRVRAARERGDVGRGCWPRTRRGGRSC